MAGICILTDNTSQFPNPIFPGHHLVYKISLHVQVNGHDFDSPYDLPLTQLPPTQNGHEIKTIPPTCNDFLKAFTKLRTEYREVIAILLSQNLNDCLENARLATYASNLNSSIIIINSETTSAGLGFLVQKAAEAANDGADSSDIIHMLRGLIPHIYTIFFVRGLTYLHNSGHMSISQAVIGEMLGITPLLILERKRLVPIQKARNLRQLMDNMIEFLEEFGELDHIALMQGLPVYKKDATDLREKIQGAFPDTSLSIHRLNSVLATILGPQCLGLVIVDHIP